MTVNQDLLGKHIRTIHNLESVVEVYYDEVKKEINELKSLNYNRYKVYNYSLEAYSTNLKRYNLVLPGQSA